MICMLYQITLERRPEDIILQLRRILLLDSGITSMTNGEYYMPVLLFGSHSALSGHTCWYLTTMNLTLVISCNAVVHMSHYVPYFTVTASLIGKVL